MEQLNFSNKEEGRSVGAKDGVKPPPPPTAPPPTVLEYQPDGSSEVWRCAAFELLSGTFLVARDEMPDFHMVAAFDPSAWMIIRRLFRISPLILPSGANPDDYSGASRMELTSVLGITAKQLDERLDAVRGIWKRMQSRRTNRVTEGAGARSAVSPQVTGSGGVVEESPREILMKHGFSESLFRLEGREAAESEMEKRWFTERVVELNRELQDRAGGALMRQRLFVELDLRRVEEYKPQFQVASAEYKMLVARERELRGELEGLSASLVKYFPFASQQEGRERFSNSISELVEGIRDAYAKGDMDRLDGVFDRTGVQVEFRASEQIPRPRYRFGLVVAIHEAMGGLYDREFRRTVPRRVLKKLDAICKSAIAEVMRLEKEMLPNLESDGLDGEFPEFEEMNEANEGDDEDTDVPEEESPFVFGALESESVCSNEDPKVRTPPLGPHPADTSRMGVE